jgi:hypothetical protein
MRQFLKLGIVRTVTALAVFASLQQNTFAANKPPSIQHDPVTYAIRGQSLTLKAKVSDPAPGVQDVTLYYALFRDAAPFRVAMRSTGLDFYVGTIDAALIKDVETIAYYIEAQDKDGAMAETSWYNVEFRKPDDAQVKGGDALPTPAPGGTTQQEGANWKTVGLIAGGAAVIAGGAALLAGGGGGGGGGSDSDGGGSDGGGNAITNQAGSYAGTVTTCLTISGQTPQCESHACTSVIDNKGVVFSESLIVGKQLTGNLSGNSFILSGPATPDATVTEGTLNFNGTVLSDRIVGSITGNATTAGGPGSYSGTFSASKQP